MKIWFEKDSHYAPCCYILKAENGKDILVQLDWDYPSIASNWGFIPCDKCDCTWNAFCWAAEPKGGQAGAVGNVEQGT